MRTSYRPAGQLSTSDRYEDDLDGHRAAERRAWAVLWSAFICFWLLVIGAFIAAKHYYDTASLPGSATLSLEQGIVLFRDAVTSTLINAQDKLALREGDDLLVGQGARASVSLFDGSTVLLYSGSELELSELRKSRFHDGFTRVVLRLEKGTARFLVGAPQTRTAQFLVVTPHGSAALGKGSFSMAVSDSQSRLSSREGVASTADGAAAIGPGEKLLLTKEKAIGPLPEGDELLVNGDFAQGFAGWQNLDVNEAGRDVEPGERMLVTQKINGQDTVALRVTRVSQKATHGETGLTQAVNSDVSDYRSLAIHMNVRVDEQSLSGGGYMGYEYPIMIRVRYRDSAGGQVDWSHGFFYRNPEGRPTPNGEQVPRGQWFEYKGDLMQVQPKPAYIIAVDVLGAGHTYDGMVANVQLVGK